MGMNGRSTPSHSWRPVETVCAGSKVRALGHLASCWTAALLHRCSRWGPEGAMSPTAVTQCEEGPELGPATAPGSLTPCAIRAGSLGPWQETWGGQAVGGGHPNTLPDWRFRITLPSGGLLLKCQPFGASSLPVKGGENQTHHVGFLWALRLATCGKAMT